MADGDVPPTEYFCIKEAAAHSGLPIAGLYRLAREGRLPHFWDGEQLRIIRHGLEAYLALLDPDAMKYRAEWQGYF